MLLTSCTVLYRHPISRYILWNASHQSLSREQVRNQIVIVPVSRTSVRSCSSRKHGGGFNRHLVWGNTPHEAAVRITGERAVCYSGTERRALLLPFPITLPLSLHGFHFGWLLLSSYIRFKVTRFLSCFLGRFHRQQMPDGGKDDMYFASRLGYKPQGRGFDSQ
jgi:hypothetical protein